MEFIPHDVAQLSILIECCQQKDEAEMLLLDSRFRRPVDYRKKRHRHADVEGARVWTGAVRKLLWKVLSVILDH